MKKYSVDSPCKQNNNFKQLVSIIEHCKGACEIMCLYFDNLHN